LELSKPIMTQPIKTMPWPTQMPTQMPMQMPMQMPTQMPMPAYEQPVQETHLHYMPLQYPYPVAASAAYVKKPCTTNEILVLFILLVIILRGFHAHFC
jgi:hypothetical protein